MQLRSTPRFRHLLVTLVLGSSACGGEGGKQGDNLDSGFLSDTQDGGGSDDGEETWGGGELRGILTYTLYAADALTGQDHVGMAGAWRNDVAAVEDLDDFYAAVALNTAFPLPPEAEDELEQNEIPPGFEWGEIGEWVEAGTAFKLQGPESASLACLLQLGMVGNIYPVYLASGSDQSPPECAPDPAAFVPASDYDLVLYGGDRFATQVYTAAVETPEAFEVTAPDFMAFNDTIVQSDGFNLTWDKPSSDRDRIVIRVWDDYGRMFTVHAADDGRYSVPASALAELTLGPITVTVAREHLERIPFSQGGVKVVTRYERRGYFDLVAEAPP